LFFGDKQVKQTPLNINYFRSSCKSRENKL